MVVSELKAFRIELEKVAKSRYMKELGKALSKGRHNKAEDIISSGTQGRVDILSHVPDLKNLRAFVAHGGVKTRKGYKSGVLAKGKGFDVSDDSIMSATRRAMRDSRKLGNNESISTRLRNYKRNKSDPIPKVSIPNLGIKGSSYVEHTGNSQHIKKFLNKGNVGNKAWFVRQKNKPVKHLENSIAGPDEFNKYYKYTSVQRYGGTPATLRAKIDNTYLKRPWGKENSELVTLNSKNVGKLKNVKVKKEYLPAEQAISGIGDKSKRMAETLAPFKWGGGIVG